MYHIRTKPIVLSSAMRGNQENPQEVSSGDLLRSEVELGNNRLVRSYRML